jgi:hypothetical protein
MHWFRKRRKVFVIGRNKTGTTSLRVALKSLGFKVGKQATAELLREDWARRDFRRIIRYCRSADAFQDVPFSLDYTWQAMDQAFPGSRFILSVRNDAQEWFESLTRFHTQLIGKGRLPTPDDLKEYPYRAGKGWLWRGYELSYGADESHLYDPQLYMRRYEAHNARVMDYFRFRPRDLLVLNVSHPDAMKSLCNFLEVRAPDTAMPHRNRSSISL